MKLTKDLNVTVEDGDYKILMGKGLTTLYFKNVEKFVFRTHELDSLVGMIQAGKAELDKRPPLI